MTTANTEGLSARLRKFVVESSTAIGGLALVLNENPEVIVASADALDAKDKLLDEAEKALQMATTADNHDSAQECLDAIDDVLAKIREHRK